MSVVVGRVQQMQGSADADSPQLQQHTDSGRVLPQSANTIDSHWPTIWAPGRLKLTVRLDSSLPR